MKNFTKLAIIAAAILVIFSVNILVQRVANFTPEKVFKRYIELQRGHDYKKTYYSCFSSRYRKNISLPDFEKLQKETSTTLGFTINKEIRHTEILKDAKGKKIYLILALGFYPTGVATENYVFVREIRGWKIDNYQIISHLLDPAERKRAKEFLEGLPEGARESHKRMLESQGISVD